MNMHHILLILHLIAATIWVGGHLVLSIAFLPEALRKREPQIILNFESKFGKVGLSALATLIITGIWMAFDFNATIGTWFSFASPIESVVSTKLSLLLLTFAFALNAQIRVIPKLSPKNLNVMAFHIISVTTIGVLMLILGSTIRYGGM